MLKSRYKIVFIFTITTIIIFGTITTGKTTLGSELSRLYNALFLNADSIWATLQRHVPSLLNPLGLSRPIAVMKHLLVSRQQADYVHSVI